MKSSSLLSAFVAFSAAKAASNSSTSLPSAKVNNTVFQGLYANQIEGFLGIYYGQDTGGQNRFKPPVPYTYNATFVQATDPGPACPQKINNGKHGAPDPFTTYSYVTEISEDCLRLNVWRPNGTTAGDKLPVLVYIYGGGFSSGTKDGILSQPGGMQLAAIENGHPIMNVEMNYRLGVFGFGQSKPLLEEGSVNAGVRDQRLALEWVQANIAAFGGDPDKITIHGQSSGGLAVGIQMLAYGATKPFPFQQAICESQCLEPGITGNFSLHATYRTAIATNCTENFNNTAGIECLRALSMDTLLKAQIETHSASFKQNQGDSWLPVPDGDFIPDAPSKLMAEKRIGNISAIIGWTDNDAMLFTDTSIDTAAKVRTAMAEYLPALTEENLDKLLALYPISDFHTTYFSDGKVKVHAQTYRCGRIYRDILFTCQGIFYGQQLKSLGKNVYFYNWNQSMFSADLRHVGAYGLGVVHTSELLYVFGNLTKFDYPGWPYNPTKADFRMRDQGTRSWSSFVAVGQPSLDGHDTLPGWAQAEFDNENFGTYVAGGAYRGYSGTGGEPRPVDIMAAEKLQERCGFLNTPEIRLQQQY